MKDPQPSTNRDTRILTLGLVACLLACLAAGCQSTGSSVTDIAGNPLEAGPHLPGERWDAAELGAHVKSVVVVPWSAAPALRTRANLAVLESAAVIASEEFVRELRRQGHLEKVGFGDGSEGADLVVRGRVMDYTSPTQTSDRIGAGRQALAIAIEARAGDEVVAALATRETNSNRRWYESEERDLQALSRVAGRRLAAVLSTGIATER